VKEYSKGLAKLNNIADAKRIPLPDTLVTETSGKIAALSEKNGNDFDRAYIDYITADHNNAIAIFEAAHKNCFDKEIKSTARKGVLVFKRHLEALSSIRDSMH
jgi:putative membrane protein